MTAVVILLAAVAFLGCTVNLRTATITLILVGFLQDPLRKLVPGEPVFITALICVFLVVAFLFAVLRHDPLGMQGIVAWRRSLRRPALFMLWLIGVQCLRTFLVTGNPMLPIIGLISYLTPVPAIVIGSRMLGTPERVTKILRVYMVLTVALSLSVSLGFLGFKSRLLESVGSGLFIYGEKGPVELQTGFMRATEVTAWHIGAGVALAIVLATRKRLRLGVLVPMVICAVWMLSTVILTGRRKILFGLVLFVIIYFLSLRFLTKSRRGGGVLVAAVVIAGGLLVVLPDMEMFRSSAGATYLERTTNTSGFDRIGSLSGELYRVVYFNGLFGLGAGLGAQGSQHYGAGVGVVGGDAESGPGRIASELGVLGIFGLIWLAFAFVNESRRALRVLAARDKERAAIAAGFVSFLAMNSAIFLVYHQVFGDPFVLTMIGFVAGGVLGLSRLAPASSRERTHARATLPARAWAPPVPAGETASS